MICTCVCTHAELYEVDAKEILSLSDEEKKRLLDLVKINLVV